MLLSSCSDRHRYGCGAGCFGDKSLGCNLLQCLAAEEAEASRLGPPGDGVQVESWWESTGIHVLN